MLPFSYSSAENIDTGWIQFTDCVVTSNEFGPYKLGATIHTIDVVLLTGEIETYDTESIAASGDSSWKGQLRLKTFNWERQ